MDSETDNRKKIIAALAVLLVIVVIVGALTLGKKDETSPASTVGTSTQRSQASTADTTSTSTTFKDGTYTATGGYNSPGGAQEITVTVTLKDGIVTTTSAKSGATDPQAQEKQDDFIANYKDQVVGKKIDTIKLGRIAGSSLTPNGFNNAIDQIEDQAKV